MTDFEWATCADSMLMLEFIRTTASDRKLRLLAVACCRRISDLLPDKQCRLALETAEQFAEGLASSDSLRQARDDSYQSFVNYTDYIKPDIFIGSESAAAAVTEACWTNEDDRNLSLRSVLNNCLGLAKLLHDPVYAWSIESSYQCRDILDIFGNPYRHADLPLGQLTPEIIMVAKRIYDKRDFAKVGDLANLLKRTVDSNKEFINHLSHSSEHTLGCWVIDRILSKS